MAFGLQPGRLRGDGELRRPHRPRHGPHTHRRALLTRTGAWRGMPPPPARPNARVSHEGRACGGGADEIERARHLTRNERRCAGRLRRGTGTGRYILTEWGELPWFGLPMPAPASLHPSPHTPRRCLVGAAERTEPNRAADRHLSFIARRFAGHGQHGEVGAQLGGEHARATATHCPCTTLNRPVKRSTLPQMVWMLP